MSATFVSYLQDSCELKTFSQNGIKEVLISVSELSRFGQLSSSEAMKLADLCRDYGIRPILEWDILMTQNRFEALQYILEKIDFNKFEAIRVQDPGAFEYSLELCEKFSNLKVQLCLESGNHNLKSIQYWIEYGKDHLERVILSIELPKVKLLEIVEKISCEVEVLALGRILLFYSPRSLVRPLANKSLDIDDETTFLEVHGSSQESPHSGFPIVENRHGTFMFHIKDHCLLEDFYELSNRGVHFFRIDTRFYNGFKSSEKLDLFLKKVSSYVRNQSQSQLREVKGLWPAKLIQGFFRSNKSDVLFKKLKNSRLQTRDENFVGDIVEVVRHRHMAILLKSKTRSVQLGDQLNFLTPDGKKKSFKLERMKNARGEKLDYASHGQVIFIEPLNGISVKSMVYSNV